MMARYYPALFDGALGFQLAQTFEDRPSLFGWQIDTSSAEESFSVYDHDSVYIFRKTRKLTREELLEILDPEEQLQNLGDA